MEPGPTILNLLLVIFLVLLNGFFVAAEFAMVKVRNTRIKTLLLEGNLRAKFAQKLTNNLDAYLSACQLGITLASLGLGWVGEPAIASALEPTLSKFDLSSSQIHSISFVIAFSIITFLHIVLGELAPKSIAIQKAESTTLWLAMPLITFHKIMYPFIWFLNGTANWFLGLIGFKAAGEHEAAHNEEEIRILMEESHKKGLIDNTELTFVDNIFEFTEKNVREIMIPRTDMVCLYTQNTFEENLEIAINEQNTRYPVCDTDKDNIVGFIHIKDFFKSLKNGNHENLQKMLRGILFVPESMSISSLLKLMQKNKSQIAIVVDEHGGTAGLVTIEDILEEIVGEIQDEFDEERPLIENLDNNSYRVDGRLLLEDANEHLGFNLTSEDFDTIGGWLYSKMEINPEVNKKIDFEDFEFIIEEIDHLRITKIIVTKKAPTNDLESFE